MFVRYRPYRLFTRAVQQCASTSVCKKQVHHVTKTKRHALSSGLVSTKQALELGLRWAVETVGGLFQTVTILNRHAATRRCNQAFALKSLQRAGYAGAANAEHQGDEFVREQHLIMV